MTTARSKQVCLEQTLWYHCTTSCVRRAYICGFDALTKRDFSHRRAWIEDRLHLLNNVFCIDIGGYAIMSNHYHVVLRIDVDRATRLTDEEVVQRWSLLYPNNAIVKRYLVGEEFLDDDILLVRSRIIFWRSELASLSRFMAEINQKIALKANREDGCKGKFWEARYDSQAILDDDALLRTLIYVDLNPVRAKMTRTPEASEFTAICRRLKEPECGLIPFDKKPTLCDTQPRVEYCLPITIEDYLSLLDWTGREIRATKRGSIPANAPSIFNRLNYSPQQWLQTQQPTINWQQRALGGLQKIEQYCAALGRHWIWQAEEHTVRR